MNYIAALVMEHPVAAFSMVLGVAFLVEASLNRFRKG